MSWPLWRSFVELASECPDGLAQVDLRPVACRARRRASPVRAARCLFVVSDDIDEDTDDEVSDGAGHVVTVAVYDGLEDVGVRLDVGAHAPR